MKPVSEICALVTFLMIGPNTVASQSAHMTIVGADSVALRLVPSAEATVVRFASPSLQLQVLSASADSTWLKVKIGEQKGYQLRHAEQFWVRRADVTMPLSTRARVEVDLSVLEVPPGRFARRITANEFLAARGDIPGSFYVSTRYTNRSDPSCDAPFGVCAQIYYPGNYFLGLGDRPETDRPLFDTLYADSTVRVRYEIVAPVAIRTIREKVVVARVLMGDAGCYAEDYRGTEAFVIRDTIRTADSARVSSDVGIGPQLLFGGAKAAQVQYVNVMWVLQPTYEDGSTEQIVRRILIWWPRCM